MNDDISRSAYSSAALERFLHTDPRDVGCEQAVELLHLYVELVAAAGSAS